MHPTLKNFAIILPSMILGSFAFRLINSFEDEKGMKDAVIEVDIKGQSESTVYI